MRACNAGQSNFKEHVPRVSLIYRKLCKTRRFLVFILHTFKGHNFEFFQNTKKCSSNGLFLHITPYFASNHEMSLSKSKNFFKTLFFAAEKSRLKPTIWRSKNRLK